MITSKRNWLALLAIAGASVMGASPAHAVRYALKAAPYLETQSDGTQVTMWGYRGSVPDPTATQIASLAAATTGFTSPGPALIVPPGDNTLEITLINGLPAGNSTSLIVHGLVNGSTPVFATAPDASGTTCTPGSGTLAEQRACRLRSLTHETPVGTATAQHRVYRFTNVPPGTYLYQSGTHQQVQVQMGLYGMMTKDAQPFGTLQRYAYGSADALSVPFESEHRLVFSEIDAQFHAAVEAGTASGSIVNYRPTHFRLHRYGPTNLPVLLVHREVVNPTTGAISYSTNQTFLVPSAERQLVRMVNAGLTSRSPGADMGHMQFVAEDGKPYPYPREQSVVLLAAAKSTDAVIAPLLNTSATSTGEADIVLFDRRAGLVTTPDGRLNGDYIRLRMNQASMFPKLDLSGLFPNATQGVLYTGMAAASPGYSAAGVAQSKSFALLQAPTGMTISATTGAVSWTPTNLQAQRPADPAILNAVTVQVTSNGRTDVGTTYIAVQNVNDAPVAVADAYTFGAGTLTTTAANGVKANDSDPDGDALGDVTIVSALAFSGTPLAGSATYPSPTVDSFSVGLDGAVTFSARNQTWYQSLLPTQTQKVTFTYQVPDTGAPTLTATGTVTLSVQGHKAPVANADSAVYTGMATQPVANRPFIEIDVLANDTAEATWEIVPTTLTKSGTLGSTGGTFSVVVAGTGGTACTPSTALLPGQKCVLRYRPAATNVNGTSEQIRYTVKDNNAFPRTSNVGVVTITLNP